MLHMSWNSEAAANAQKWANTCSMKHSPDSSREISTSGCGENLYMFSQKNSWSDAIQFWYDEVKDWRYGVGSVNGGVVGHFTQVPSTSAFFGSWTFTWPWESSEEDVGTGSSVGSSGGSSGGSSSTGGSAVTPAEEQEIVAKHNALRRGVQPPASNMLKMSWNNEAAANAQAWVSKCTGTHSKDEDRKISTSGCGENWTGSSAKESWSTIIQGWYNEVNDWKYGVGSINGRKVGHFTQVVWYKSFYVGCAMAYCPNHNYKYHYVCQYCPPGNYQYARPYNSGQTCASCSSACDDKLCTNPCRYNDKYSNCPSLKNQWGCQNDVTSSCHASCKCTNNEIM